MADTVASKAAEETHGGSSPPFPTKLIWTEGICQWESSNFSCVIPGKPWYYRFKIHDQNNRKYLHHSIYVYPYPQSFVESFFGTIRRIKIGVNENGSLLGFDYTLTVEYSNMSEVINFVREKVVLTDFELLVGLGFKHHK